MQRKITLRRLTASSSPIVVSLVLSGCASVQSDPATAPATAAADVGAPGAVAPREDVPGVALTEELIYDILVGEIAGQRGHADVAVESLSRAALSTRDPRLVRHATRVALSAQRFDKALETARLWVEISPDEQAPREVLARTLLALDHRDEAFEQFAIVLGQNDDVGVVYRRIAELLGRLDDPGDVLERFERLVAMHPTLADAHYAKAYLAERLGQRDVTAQALDESLRLRPGWEEAAMAKLVYLATAGAPADVEAFAEQFLQRYPKASRVRAQYARYLIDQERPAESLAQFERLLRADPRDSDALFAAGLLSVQVEEYRRAQDYLMRHLELLPDSDRTRIYLGQAAMELEQYDDAERWYAEVSGREFYLDAQLMIAAVKAAQGNVEGAIEHLEQLRAGSEDEQVRLVLGRERIYREAGRLADAKEVLDEALAEIPENSDLLYARGLVAAQLNLVALHESDLRKLISMEPDNAHAYNALGYTLADQTDRYQEALELIEKALELKPNDPFIMDSMGWVQYRLGNHQLAIDYLERAFDIREDAEIAAHLGEVLWIVGDRQRAEAVWNRALEQAPANDVLLGTIRKLKQ